MGLTLSFPSAPPHAIEHGRSVRGPRYARGAGVAYRKVVVPGAVAVVFDSVVTSTQSHLERRVGVVVVGFKLKRATWADLLGSSSVPARTRK